MKSKIALVNGIMNLEGYRVWDTQGKMKKQLIVLNVFKGLQFDEGTVIEIMTEKALDVLKRNIPAFANCKLNTKYYCINENAEMLALEI